MEPDISIWRKTGHFYFALTQRPEKPWFDFILSAHASLCFQTASYRNGILLILVGEASSW